MHCSLTKDVQPVQPVVKSLDIEKEGQHEQEGIIRDCSMYLYNGHELILECANGKTEKIMNSGGVK